MWNRKLLIAVSAKCQCHYRPFRSGLKHGGVQFGSKQYSVSDSETVMFIFMYGRHCSAWLHDACRVQRC